MVKFVFIEKGKTQSKNDCYNMFWDVFCLYLLPGSSVRKTNV